MENVKIYVLVDPLTLKVRYIGITTSSLIRRLWKHIDDSLYRKSKKSSHKRNWINKLLEGGRFPIIKKIYELDDWKKALVIERCLIKKYKISRNLTNYEEYKEGGSFGRKLTEEEKERVSKKVREWYKNGGVNGLSKPIKYFDLSSTFLGEFPSIKEASRQLKISSRHISLVLDKLKPQVKGFVFRYKEDSSIVNPVDFDPHWATKKKIKIKNMLTNEIKEFRSQSEFATEFNISNSLIYHHKKHNKGFIKSKNIQIL